jgi:hypothetical protein
MKKRFSMLVVFCALFASSGAFANLIPVTQDVPFRSPQFSQMVYEALAKTARPAQVVRAGGTSSIIQIGNGLMCEKDTALVSGGKLITRYACKLMRNSGWRFSIRGMEAYGSGDNPAFTKALFHALALPEKKEESFTLKTLELVLGGGGHNRNQLSCMIPTLDGEKLGLRPTCQFLNAI